jgi:antitoxin (DNA-binding transcriptional repressor) of toxin-antitoxin stability system
MGTPVLSVYCCTRVWLSAAVATEEEMVIARARKPLAKLLPYQEAVEPRTPGYWHGWVRIAPDFDELPEGLAAACRGEVL